MYAHMNFVSMVDTTLMRSTLVVIILSHYLVVGSQYNIQLSPTVMQMQLVLSLLELTGTTIRLYVTLVPSRNADWGMNKMLLVPLIRVPMP